MPTVSIVIPTFNCATFLAETLKGVANQSFCDFEVIVVDDGSSDATGRVVRDFNPTIQ